MFSLTWKYFCLQVSIFLHHWYSFKILFFFSQRAHRSQKTSLAGQWLWEISVEWELRNCDYWAVVNPSHENIWMWERIDIILPVAGEHKCKATVQLVRITRHEYPWVDIHYKNTATLRVPNPCRKTSENIAFWSNADTIYYSVTHGSTELADLLEGPVHVGGESANWCMVLLLNRSWHSHHHSVVPEYALWLSRGHECRCHPAHKNNFKKDGWQKFCQVFFFLLEMLTDQKLKVSESGSLWRRIYFLNTCEVFPQPFPEWILRFSIWYYFFFCIVVPCYRSQD